jgi:hypothetical protein
LRFLRRLGVAEKRSYREWTTREQQRLIELIDELSIFVSVPCLAGKIPRMPLNHLWRSLMRPNI